MSKRKKRRKTHPKKTKHELTLKQRRFIIKMARRTKLVKCKVNEVDYNRTSPTVFKALCYELCGKPHIFIWERCRLVHMVIHYWSPKGLKVGQFNLMKDGLTPQITKQLNKHIIQKNSHDNTYSVNGDDI